MREIGIVESVCGENISVRIKRASACGENCASCKGGCVPTEQIVTAQNDAKARVGDTVVLQMKSSRVLFAAFLVYIVPLVAQFTGFLISYSIFKNEGLSMLIGIISMGLVWIIVKRMDKKLKGNYIHIAVDILQG